MKKVAVMGCGIVGTGIVDILTDKKEDIAKKLGEEIERSAEINNVAFNFSAL